MAVKELSKEDYKIKHLETYKNVLMEVVKNNNKGLLEEDILSLIKKPPLDSMDTIKGKILALAKQENVILEGDSVSKLISTYRENLSEEIIPLLDIRKTKIIGIIKDFSPNRGTEVLKIELKDFGDINKKIKSGLKKVVSSCVDTYLLEPLDKIYKKDINEKAKAQINKLFSKFLKNDYMKKLFNDIEIKILVKDRTLINGINEQGERYLFTLEKSYLLK